MASHPFHCLIASHDCNRNTLVESPDSAKYEQPELRHLDSVKPPGRSVKSTNDGEDGRITEDPCICVAFILHLRYHEFAAFPYSILTPLVIAMVFCDA